MDRLALSQIAEMAGAKILQGSPEILVSSISKDSRTIQPGDLYVALQGENFDNDRYVSMKAFWDLFTGEITHEYACTSCKSTIENRELINYLLLKFPQSYQQAIQSLILRF